MPHVDVYQFKLQVGGHRTLVVALPAYRLAKSVPPIDLAKLARQLSVACAIDTAVVNDSVRGETLVLSGAVGEGVLDHFHDEYIAAFADIRLHFTPPPTKTVKKKAKKKKPPLVVPPPPKRDRAASKPPLPPGSPGEDSPIRERTRELRSSLAVDACEGAGSVLARGARGESHGGGAPAPAPAATVSLENTTGNAKEEEPPLGRALARRDSTPPPPPPDELGAPGIITLGTLPPPPPNEALVEEETVRETIPGPPPDIQL